MLSNKAQSLLSARSFWLNVSVLLLLTFSTWLLDQLNAFSDSHMHSIAVKHSHPPHPPAGALSPEFRPDLSWEHVFGMKFNLTMTPLAFYDAFEGLSSGQLTDLLKESELHATDISEWLEDHRNLTLQPNDLSKDLRSLADIYGLDRLGISELRRGFKGSSLYYEIESIICDIASEQGTHFHFLGDSTVQGLLGNGLHPFLKECRRRYSRKTRLHGGMNGNKETSFYFQRAFNTTFEAKDYSVPNGTKRTIVIANFDSLHALSLFPFRPFERLPDGRLFFNVFDDFVQYQLNKVSQYPVETFLITVGPNAVAESRYTGGYRIASAEYDRNPAEYSKRCSMAWNEATYEMCRDAPLNSHGSWYLSQRIASLMPSKTIDVDAYYITQNQGYLSPEGDGRHFKPLAHLKMVQIIVLYMVRRIGKHLEALSHGHD